MHRTASVYTSAFRTWRLVSPSERGLVRALRHGTRGMTAFVDELSGDDHDAAR